MIVNWKPELSSKISIVAESEAEAEYLDRLYEAWSEDAANLKRGKTNVLDFGGVGPAGSKSLQVLIIGIEGD